MIKKSIYPKTERIHQHEQEIPQEPCTDPADGGLCTYLPIVKIDTDNSPFKYDGLNILQTVPVEPYEAVLGSKINVKTQNGQVSMKLMSGTMNGQKYRLTKQGLEKDGQKGDMIVTISIEIPKNLSKEEVILYEKLKQAASNRNIREINYEQ